MAKKEWLVVVWNDGSGQFSIERLAATEEEIKNYRKKYVMSVQIALMNLEDTKNLLQKILWCFMRMLLLIHIISSMKHVH
mgnify:CR=1 FL=1